MTRRCAVVVGWLSTVLAALVAAVVAPATGMSALLLVAVAAAAVTLGVHR